MPSYATFEMQPHQTSNPQNLPEAPKQTLLSSFAAAKASGNPYSASFAAHRASVQQPTQQPPSQLNQWQPTLSGGTTPPVRQEQPRPPLSRSTVIPAITNTPTATPTASGAVTPNAGIGWSPVASTQQNTCSIIQSTPQYIPVTTTPHQRPPVTNIQQQSPAVQQQFRPQGSLHQPGNNTPPSSHLPRSSVNLPLSSYPVDPFAPPSNSYHPVPGQSPSASSCSLQFQPQSTSVEQQGHLQVISSLVQQQTQQRTSRSTETDSTTSSTACSTGIQGFPISSSNSLRPILSRGRQPTTDSSQPCVAQMAGQPTSTPTQQPIHPSHLGMLSHFGAQAHSQDPFAFISTTGDPFYNTTYRPPHPLHQTSTTNVGQSMQSAPTATGFLQQGFPSSSLIQSASGFINPSTGGPFQGHAKNQVRVPSALPSALLVSNGQSGKRPVSSSSHRVAGTTDDPFAGLPIVPAGATISPDDPIRAPYGCCEVCWEDGTSSGRKSELIKCIGCGLCVHRACCGLQFAEDLSNWKCSVCEYWISRGYSITALQSLASRTTLNDSTSSRNVISLHADDATPSPSSSSSSSSSSQTHRYPPSLHCAMCLRVGGVMCVGSEGLWAHISCITFSGEGPSFLLPSLYQRPSCIRRYLLLHQKEGYQCSICRQTIGYTQKCGYPSCSFRVHIPCAFRRELKPKAEVIQVQRTDGTVTERSVKIVSCQLHTTQESRQQILAYQSSLIEQAEALGWDLISARRKHHHGRTVRVRPTSTSTIDFNRPSSDFGKGVSPATYGRFPGRRWPYDEIGDAPQPMYIGDTMAPGQPKRRWGTPTAPQRAEPKEEIPQCSEESKLGQCKIKSKEVMDESNEGSNRRKLLPGALGGAAYSKKVRNRLIDKMGKPPSSTSISEGQARLGGPKQAPINRTSYWEDSSIMRKKQGDRLVNRLKLQQSQRPSSDATDKLVPTVSPSTAYQRLRQLSRHHESDDDEDIGLDLYGDDDESIVSSAYGKSSYVSGESTRAKPKQRYTTDFSLAGRSSTRDSASTTGRSIGRPKALDRRGRTRRRGRASSLEGAESSDHEGLGTVVHLGPASHVIQKGVRLKWARYEQFFKRSKFLSVAQRSPRKVDEKWPLSASEAIRQFAARPNPTSDPVVSQLAPFLLSESSSPLTVDFVNESPGHEKSKMLNLMAKLLCSLLRQVWQHYLCQSSVDPQLYVSPITALVLLSAATSTDERLAVSYNNKSLGMTIWSVWEAFDANNEEKATQTLSQRNGGSKSSSRNEAIDKHPDQESETLFFPEFLSLTSSLESYVATLRPDVDLPNDSHFVILWDQTTSKRPEVAELIRLGRLLSDQISSTEKSLSYWLHTHPTFSRPSDLPASPFYTSQFLSSLSAIRLLTGLRLVDYLCLSSYQSHFIAKRLSGIQDRDPAGLIKVGGGPCCLSLVDSNEELDNSTHVLASEDTTNGEPNHKLKLELIVDNNKLLNLKFLPYQEAATTDSITLLSSWSHLYEMQQSLYASLSGGSATTSSLALKSQLIMPLETSIDGNYETLMTEMTSSAVLKQQSIETDPPVVIQLHDIRPVNDRQAQSANTLTPSASSLKTPQLPFLAKSSTGVKTNYGNEQLTTILPDGGHCHRGHNKRYIYLNDALWDTGVSLSGCDPLIVHALKPSSPPIDTSGIATRHALLLTKSAESSPLDKLIPCDDFVGRQCAFYLSLFNQVARRLSECKSAYFNAILREEELPPRLIDVPSVTPSVNALFLMGVRWGKVSAHLSWGLTDQPDQDFALPLLNSQQQIGNPLSTLSVNQKKDPSLLPPPLPTNLPSSECLTIPGGRFGSPVVPVNSCLRSMNVSDVARSLIRPYENASSFTVPLPPFAAGSGRTRTCCICFGAEWDSVNAILTCMQCHTSVHKGCYGVTDTTLDAETENWLCKRCEYEKRRSGTDGFVSGSLRCELCNTLGGALKRTMDDRWVHLTCALMLLPEVVPTDLQLLDNWNINGLQHWRTEMDCSVCSVGHVPNDDDIKNEEDNWKKEKCYLDCYPLRLSELPPHKPICQFVTHRRGVCLRCSHPKCDKTFHPMCAWLAGMYINVLRKKDEFYPWSQTMDQIYFPTIQASIFCFDHSPQQLIAGSVKEHQPPEYRSSGYQRCLRHRRYINRDLYPHLCSPGNKRGRTDSPMLTANTGGQCGTPFSFAYAADSDSQQMMIKNNINKIKMLPLSTPADVKQLKAEINSNVEFANVVATNQRNDNNGMKIGMIDSNEISSASFSLPEQADQVWKPEVTSTAQENSKTNSGTYLKPLQCYGVDPIDPSDPNSVYLIGKPSINDRRLTLSSESSTYMNLTFPKLNELTLFPDKYCDRFCAVCFCRSEPSTIGIGKLDESIAQMNHHIKYHTTQLVRCRRCGLAVHPTCYGIAHLTESQLRLCLGTRQRLRSTRESLNGIELSRAKLSAQNNNTSDEDVSDKEDLVTPERGRKDYISRKRNRKARGAVPQKITSTEEEKKLSTTNIEKNEDGIHDHSSIIPRSPKRRRIDLQQRNVGEMLTTNDETQQVIKREYEQYSKQLTTDSGTNDDSLVVPEDNFYFTCDVCSSCHLIDDVTCLLCSRRSGALKSIRLMLDWTPLHDDEDLNDFQTMSAFSGRLKGSSSSAHHDPRNSIIVYAHVTCLLYCPGVTVGNSDDYQPIRGLERVVRSLFYGAHKCELCHSFRGVCLPCSQPGCKSYFHPLCAQLEGCVLEQRVEGSDMSLSVVGYCKKHSSLLSSESIPLSILDQLRGLLEKARLVTHEVQSRWTSKLKEISCFTNCMSPVVTSLDARYGCTLPGCHIGEYQPAKAFVPLTQNRVATVDETRAFLDSNSTSVKPMTCNLTDDLTFQSDKNEFQRNSTKSCSSNGGTSSPQLLYQSDPSKRSTQPRLKRQSFNPTPTELPPSNLPPSSTPTSVIPTEMDTITRQKRSKGLSLVATAGVEYATVKNRTSDDNTCLVETPAPERHQSVSPIRITKKPSPVAQRLSTSPNRDTNSSSGQSSSGITSVEDVSLLPSFTGMTVEELVAAGQQRELTMIEMIDLARQLLPEFSRRKRGRPSAREKIVRCIAVGAYEFYKSKLLSNSTPSSSSNINADDTKNEIISSYNDNLHFWSDAEKIAAQYGGRNVQDVLCLVNNATTLMTNAASLFLPTTPLLLTSRGSRSAPQLDDTTDVRPAKRTRREQDHPAFDPLSSPRIRPHGVSVDENEITESSSGKTTTEEKNNSSIEDGDGMKTDDLELRRLPSVQWPSSDVFDTADEKALDKRIKGSESEQTNTTLPTHFVSGVTSVGLKTISAVVSPCSESLQNRSLKAHDLLNVDSIVDRSIGLSESNLALNGIQTRTEIANQLVRHHEDIPQENLKFSNDNSPVVSSFRSKELDDSLQFESKQSYRSRFYRLGQSPSTEINTTVDRQEIGSSEISRATVDIVVPNTPETVEKKKNPTSMEAALSSVGFSRQNSLDVRRSQRTRKKRIFSSDTEHDSDGLSQHLPNKSEHSSVKYENEPNEEQSLPVTGKRRPGRKPIGRQSSGATTMGPLENIQIDAFSVLKEDEDLVQSSNSKHQNCQGPSGHHSHNKLDVEEQSDCAQSSSSHCIGNHIISYDKLETTSPSPASVSPSSHFISPNAHNDTGKGSQSSLGLVPIMSAPSMMSASIFKIPGIAIGTPAAAADKQTLLLPCQESYQQQENTKSMVCDNQNKTEIELSESELLAVKEESNKSKDSLRDSKHGANEDSVKPKYNEVFEVYEVSTPAVTSKGRGCGKGISKHDLKFPKNRSVPSIPSKTHKSRNGRRVVTRQQSASSSMEETAELVEKKRFLKKSVEEHRGNASRPATRKSGLLSDKKKHNAKSTGTAGRNLGGKAKVSPKPGGRGKQSHPFRKWREENVDQPCSGIDEGDDPGEEELQGDFDEFEEEKLGSVNEDEDVEEDGSEVQQPKHVNLHLKKGRRRREEELISVHVSSLVKKDVLNIAAKEVENEIQKQVEERIISQQSTREDTSLPLFKDRRVLTPSVYLSQYDYVGTLTSYSPINALGVCALPDCLITLPTALKQQSVTASPAISSKRAYARAVMPGQQQTLRTSVTSNLNNSLTTRQQQAIGRIRQIPVANGENGNIEQQASDAMLHCSSLFCSIPPHVSTMLIEASALEQKQLEAAIRVLRGLNHLRNALNENEMPLLVSLWASQNNRMLYSQIYSKVIDFQFSTMEAVHVEFLSGLHKVPMELLMQTTPMLASKPSSGCSLWSHFSQLAYPASKAKRQASRITLAKQQKKGKLKPKKNGTSTDGATEDDSSSVDQNRSTNEAFDSEEEISLMVESLKGIITKVFENTCGIPIESEKSEPIPHWSYINAQWNGELRVEALAVGQRVRIFSLEEFQWREGLIVFYDASLVPCTSLNKSKRKWELNGGNSSPSSYLPYLSEIVAPNNNLPEPIAQQNDEFDTTSENNQDFSKQIQSVSSRQNYLIFFKANSDNKNDVFEWMDIRTNEIVQFETGNRYYIDELLLLDATYHLRTALLLLPAIKDDFSSSQLRHPLKCFSCQIPLRFTKASDKDSTSEFLLCRNITKQIVFSTSKQVILSTKSSRKKENGLDYSVPTSSKHFELDVCICCYCRSCIEASDETSHWDELLRKVDWKCMECAKLPRDDVVTPLPPIERKESNISIEADLPPSSTRKKRRIEDEKKESRKKRKR